MNLCNDGNQSVRKPNLLGVNHCSQIFADFLSVARIRNSVALSKLSKIGEKRVKHSYLHPIGKRKKKRKEKKEKKRKEKKRKEKKRKEKKRKEKKRKEKKRKEKERKEKKRKKKK